MNLYPMKVVSPPTLSDRLDRIEAMLGRLIDDRVLAGSDSPILVDPDRFDLGDASSPSDTQFADILELVIARFPIETQRDRLDATKRVAAYGVTRGFDRDIVVRLAQEHSAHFAALGNHRSSLDLVGDEARDMAAFCLRNFDQIGRHKADREVEYILERLSVESLANLDRIFARQRPEDDDFPGLGDKARSSISRAFFARAVRAAIITPGWSGTFWASTKQVGSASKSLGGPSSSQRIDVFKRWYVTRPLFPEIPAPPYPMLTQHENGPNPGQGTRFVAHRELIELVANEAERWATHPTTNGETDQR